MVGIYRVLIRLYIEHMFDKMERPTAEPVWAPKKSLQTLSPPCLSSISPIVRRGFSSCGQGM